ncbi:hypothetical protein MRB53_034456 [Persea americana]|uniref:Uncharacterized protein n=1 Tax=Persea americana TaxID=3435 RepID=A0ACC2K1T4_PERAE|nr:hypothetical protein MRB53_034456 [Persea americana]
MKKPFLLSRKGIVSSRSPSPSSPFSVQRSLASVSPGAQVPATHTGAICCNRSSLFFSPHRWTSGPTLTQQSWF